MLFLKYLLLVIACAAGFALLRLLYYFIDFNALLAPVLSLGKTNERKLVKDGALMRTRTGTPFTGTSILIGKGLFISPGAHGIKDGVEVPIYESGRRIIRYKNGLKEGAEELYFTYAKSILGQLGGPRVFATLLYSRTDYHQGLQHGITTENYYGTRYLHTKKIYAHGKLHGMSTEYEYIRPNHIDEKPINKTTGPLILEKEYNHGDETGIHRTYSTVGRIDEDYIVEKGAIISGRRKLILRTPELRTCWEFYEDGALARAETYHFSAGAGPDRTRFPIEAEVFYKDGQITEERIYNWRNGKVRRHKKLINGVLTEIFNIETGIDRTAEFPE